MKTAMWPVFRSAFVPVGLARRPLGTSGPSVSSATIAANGTTLTVVFSEAITIGAGGSGGLGVRGESPANALVAATYASGDTTDTLVFTLASPFYNTEVTTLSYTQPGDGLEDGGGDDVATFVGAAMTNNSTQGSGVLRDQSGNPVRDQNDRAIKVTA